MIKKLSERDKRTLKFGAICAAAILVFGLGSMWLKHWGETRKSLADIKDKLKLIDLNETRRAGLQSIVPVFEMPQAEDEQKVLFRDRFDEQLSQARIKSAPLQFQSGTTQFAGYKLLRLKCTATCQFEQVLDLLAQLKQNPYLVSVEEIRITSSTGRTQQQGRQGGTAQQQASSQEGSAQGQATQEGRGQQRSGRGGEQQQVELNLTVSTLAKQGG